MSVPAVSIDTQRTSRSELEQSLIYTLRMGGNCIDRIARMEVRKVVFLGCSSPLEVLDTVKEVDAVESKISLGYTAATETLATALAWWPTSRVNQESTGRGSHPMGYEAAGALVQP
jgi:hypothetical protein